MAEDRIVKLGVIVPSSNTALEPSTTAIASTIPNISVHFSRFRVTEISLSDNALSQFDDSKIIDAAKLLADAKVDVIGWSGTSAGWLGLDKDRELCQKIEDATGIKATTSCVGMLNVFHEIFAGQEYGEIIKARWGLVTPYLDEVQKKVMKTFGDAGYEVVAESHLDRSVNADIVATSEDELDKQMEDVLSKMENEPIKVISTFCTNLRAAQRVAYWENRWPGLVVVDTVATVVWDMLRILGIDMKDLRAWGIMFSKAGS
ncbi:hypothetical protein CKM354_000606600 [Cercospora kikuchii]|uniref:Asp/Glu racemase n=1 Tax=Cercospora kikuchii TaxID=84275 RepID=A0A9P3FG51_9PEZI|nr:uncharacterized protein CKM354_000606600 [Cercospora kikuchii]GIZ42812.1 hypothetical protein CKM354_000606600 [Cercospora kikuchii]